MDQAYIFFLQIKNGVKEPRHPEKKVSTKCYEHLYRSTHHPIETKINVNTQEQIPWPMYT